MLPSFTTSCASRLPAVAHGANPASLGSVRYIYKGHVTKTLEKLYLPRHQWLKEVEQAPPLHSVRQQKDKYLRELGVVHRSFQEVFQDETSSKIRQAIEPPSEEEKGAAARAASKKEAVNEALRMYRLLRPEAPPFYDEDAMLSMKARLNRKLNENSAQADGMVEAEGRNNKLASMRASLPVVNQDAFLLALQSLVASLADDLEKLIKLLGGEVRIDRRDPRRFEQLVDVLFQDVFKLEKDPGKVEAFIETHWGQLSKVLPPALADNKVAVQQWLEGHLRRVVTNQARISREDRQIFLHQHEAFGKERYYSFAEDFPYDDDPMPGDLADQRNLGFPLEQAEMLMRNALGYFNTTALGTEVSEGCGAETTSEDIAAQFQELVWDLEKIGLRNWLKMDTEDLAQHLPQGDIDPIEQYDDDTKQVAKLMLKCAARGKANLLDFEAIDPHQMLHGFPAQQIEDELEQLPTNPHIHDDALELLVDIFQPAKNKAEKDIDGTSIMDVLDKELKFYKNAGPVEWTEEKREGAGQTNEKGIWSWRFRQPANAIWDARRGLYVPEQPGINPLLKLHDMRQHMLEMHRMGSMYKLGRLFYFRCIVAVGNGQGIYGFGVGFGNNPKEARSDASQKALQNLDYIDLDAGRSMCHPVKGHEYGHEVFILPRPIGKGLRANKRYLPLLYILGLDNCRVRFYSHNTRWFTRVRGLKRALDMMLSRRTLANMTGKKHAMLVAPGDHWVHWPDRWFSETRKGPDARSDHIKTLRRMVLKGKTRTRKLVSSQDVKHGWRLARWKRWVNPVECWWEDWERQTHLTNIPGKGSKDGSIPQPSFGGESPSPASPPPA
mmetsp:Transcript_48126/g.112542  ORF Transcript_48126/g.112542 Transcript_48126/m.112542 type:complete len:836 (-) Transcript_48126:25-2532(-)